LIGTKIGNFTLLYGNEQKLAQLQIVIDVFGYSFLILFWAFVAGQTGINMCILLVLILMQLVFQIVIVVTNFLHETHHTTFGIVYLSTITENSLTFEILHLGLEAVWAKYESQVIPRQDHELTRI